MVNAMSPVVTHPDKIQILLESWPLLFAWKPWMGPGLTIILGVVTGLIVEKVLLGTVRQILRHTPLELNETIASTLRGVIFWLVTLWSIYMATFGLPYFQPTHVDLIRHMVFVMAMLLSIQLLAKVAVALARFYLTYSNVRTALPNTSIFENIIRFGVYILGMLMLLQTMGVSIVPIVTALGVGGLAISLALQDPLSNLFAGIQMILARQIRVGSTIQLENGQTGEVVDIAWRTTTLRQLSGNVVILPNNKLSSNILISYNNPHPDLTVTLQVAVPLNADLQQVETLALDVAQTVGLAIIRQKMGKTKPTPFTPVVRYLSYGESWINMALQLPFPVPMDGGLVRHELFKALHARFMADNISLPFPQNVVHLDFPRKNLEELENIAKQVISTENGEPA
jgi:small-conductance mechanosensitive channel